MVAPAGPPPATTMSARGGIVASPISCTTLTSFLYITAKSTSRYVPFRPRASMKYLLLQPLSFVKRMERHQQRKNTDFGCILGGSKRSITFAKFNIIKLTHFL